MRHLALSLLVATALVFAVPSRADLESGIAAYQDQRYEEAYEQLLPLADAGEPEAQYYVGRMLCLGQGREVNKDKGAEYYDDAAKLGLAQAQIAAGDHFYAISKARDGNKYRARTLRLYLGAAKQGYPEAYLRLSTLFCEGISAPQMPFVAEGWYTLSREVDGLSPWQQLLKDNIIDIRCLGADAIGDLSAAMGAIMAEKLRQVHDLPTGNESRARFDD